MLGWLYVLCRKFVPPNAGAELDLVLGLAYYPRFVHLVPRSKSMTWRRIGTGTELTTAVEHCKISLRRAAHVYRAVRPVML